MLFVNLPTGLCCETALADAFRTKLLDTRNRAMLGFPAGKTNWFDQ
jgi:hypothetical protein